MDDSFFIRHDEAWAYVAAASDPRERLMLEFGLSFAFHFFRTDQDYRATVQTNPMDLLHFIRASHVLLRKKNLLQKILDGRITSVDDIEPFSVID